MLLRGILGGVKTLAGMPETGSRKSSESRLVARMLSGRTCDRAGRGKAVGTREPGASVYNIC